MRDRADDSLLSRLLLLLWLPLAALAGLVPLEDEQDARLPIAGALQGVSAGAAAAPLERDLATPHWTPVRLPPPVFISSSMPDLRIGPALQDIAAAPRVAYTVLLRRQLLRIPDPDAAA